MRQGKKRTPSGENSVTRYNKRAAEDGYQRGKFAPQGLAALFQSIRGFFCHAYRTT